MGRITWGTRKPQVGWNADPGAVASLNLIGAFLFNEAGGLATFNAPGVDLLGLGGPLSSGCSFSPGLFGSGIAFSGTTSNVDLGVVPTMFNLSRNFSVLAWFRLTAADSGTYALASVGNSGWYFRTNANVLEFLKSQTSVILTGGTSLAATTWYQAVLTVDPASTAKATIYLNGKQEAQTTSATTFASSAQHFCLGSEYDSGSGGAQEYFKGAIDHVLVANRCWTPAEVQKLYAEPFHWMQPQRRRVVSAGAGGGTSAISGSCDLVFGAGSSTLAGSGALAGVCSLSFGAGSSTLTGSGALVGACALAFTGTDSLTGSGALAGASACVFGAGSSTLVGAGALAGSSANTFGAGSSTLTGAGALAGVAALQFSGTDFLNGNAPISGACALTTTGTATLTGAGSLAGSAACQFGAGSSTLAGAGALAGTSANVFAGTASLTGSGALAGSCVLTTTATSTLLGAGALAGSCAVVFTPTGLLGGPGAIGGSCSLSFGGTAGLTGTGTLTGTSALSTTAAAALQGFGAMVASCNLSIGATATLRGSGALAGSAAIAVGGSGVLTNSAGGTGSRRLINGGLINSGLVNGGLVA